MAEPMNIHATRGTRVTPIYREDGRIHGGYDFDEQTANNHLKPRVYTVFGTEVHSWHTKVFLKEFPGMWFNSVCLTEDVGHVNQSSHWYQAAREQDHSPKVGDDSPEPLNP